MMGNATGGDAYQISTDRSLLDFEVIHSFLSRSYWAAGIPREVLKRAIDHSLCFGAYLGESQVGFARVTTDHATFAYLADVFVLPEHRGRGLAKRMIAAVVAHPELQGLRRWVLVTRDAHGLYSQFGFAPIQNVAGYMERFRADVYAKDAGADGAR